jgi:nucleoside phosphorylase/CheY-like chemotaxis protein
MPNDLQILLVEDDDLKFECVKHRLDIELDDLSVNFVRAADYESALSALRSKYFDFVVLDLLIPNVGGAPSINASTHLLHMLMKGDLIAPSFVIGLTGYSEKMKEVGDLYREYFLALEMFSFDDFGWASRIARQIRYMIRARLAGLKFQMESHGIDIVIFTARHDNEFVPIRDFLYRGQDVKVGHPLIEREINFGEIRGKSAALTSAIISVNEVGLAPTAAMVAQAVSVFRPKLVATLGMCCGFALEQCAHPRKLADVIVSREISLWDETKFIEADEEKGTAADPKERSKTRMVDDKLREPVGEIMETLTTAINKRLLKEVKKARWKSAVARFKPFMREVPEAIYAASVSGSSLVADSAKIAQIIDRHKRAIGLEMENYALYTTIDFLSGLKPSKLAIKGVADFGDGQKKDDVQKLASTLSAVTFLEIVEALYVRTKL